MYLVKYKLNREPNWSTKELHKAKSEAQALTQFWYWLSNGKKLNISDLKQQFQATVTEVESDIEKQNRINKQADEYRKASKGESMKTESKVNQNFDQSDTWRTTILNSVEDKDSVQFKIDETNNQELAIQNESVIGIFDNDLKYGSIVENTEQTFDNQESWMQSLGSDPVTIDQDDEGQVVVAKDAQGQVIGTYATVNGQGKGVKVEANELVALAKDRATWTNNIEDFGLFDKSEAEDLASKLGGKTKYLQYSNPSYIVVKSVLEDDSDNTAGINYAEPKLESKQTVLDLVAKFNTLSSELEHKYKIGQANSSPNAQVEFQKLNNAVQKLLDEINSELGLLGFKDGELYKPNTTNINLRIISKRIDNFVAQSDQN